MANAQRIEDIDADEKLHCKIHRHPFGLFSVYFEIIVGLVGIAVVLYFFLPTILPNSSTADINGLIVLIAVGLAIIGWIGLTAFTFIYRGSFIIVTDRNLTQVIQQGLFNRKVSELSLANVEDVTANRNGFFATLFNFGKLHVETAGEAENFNFPNCPDPDRYGKIILDARHEFVQKNFTTNAGHPPNPDNPAL